jgi:type IX secretion system PorP/SprF family membrane protein
MKRLQNINIFTILLFLVLFSLDTQAQQDPMYTQYMYNTLSVNPGYAGSRGALSITGLAREQWFGIDGRPRTQTLTLHTPIYNENMGLGLSVVNDNVGPVHQTMLYADYAYSIQTTENAKLAFGLKAGLSIFQANLNSMTPDVGGDTQIYDINNKLLPNIGIGLYYYSDKGYVGLSAPKLLQHDLETGNTTTSKELRHYFLIGGYVFDVSENLKFKPSFLVKAVEGAPLSMDLTGMAFIKEKLGVGLSYRNGDSFSGLLQYYITPQFRLGYAYDFTTTQLHDFNSGSHELMIGYDFKYGESTRIYSPRFF